MRKRNDYGHDNFGIFFGIAWAVCFILALAFIGAVVFIGLHFASKYW